MSVTQTVMPPGIQQNLLSKVLSTPEAKRIHRMGATTYDVPQHTGDILRKSRYHRLETVPVPVDPAMANPPAQLLDRDFIDVKIHYFATYIIITEQVTMVDQDPILNRASLRLNVCAAETEDLLIRDMLEATASIQHCTGGTNGKIVAVYKSSLIELELLTVKDEDNNAQAGEYLAA